MIEKPPHVEPSKPVADGKPNGNGSVQVIHEMRPSWGSQGEGSPGEGA